ncbi:MAG TPA: hypothetical protein VFP32_03095, partial [Candidatus Saccharimonadales bacterium]|nr:hypothetical protein [Candidatus Saccharimonadales bacterium]
DSMSIRLLSYLLYKTIWLFIAAFMLYELFIQLLKTFFGIRGLYYALMGAVLSGALSLYFLVALFGYGFQNFIAEVALAFAAIIVCCLEIQSTSQQRKQIYISLLALFTVASTCVWVLPGAVLGLLTITVTGKEYLSKKSSINYWCWLALVAGGFLTLSQIYVIKSMSSNGNLSSLNLGGAVPPINILAVFILIIISILLSTRVRLKKEVWLAVIIGFGSLEFIILTLYQQLSLGEQRYYDIKLAYMCTLVIATVLFALLIRFFVPKTGFIRRAMPVCLLGLLVVLPFLLGIDLRKSAYPLKDSAPIKPSTASSILSSSNNDPNKVFITDNEGESYLATKLWSAIRPYSSLQRQTLLKNMDLEIHK